MEKGTRRTQSRLNYPIEALRVWNLALTAFAWVLLIVSPLYAVDVALPSGNSRLFNYKPPWYQFRKPTHFVIRPSVKNSADKPQKADITCEIVTLDDNGDVAKTGSFVKVEPAETTLWPNVRTYFKIRVPIPEKNENMLLLFRVMARATDLKPKDTFLTILTGGSYLLAINFIHEEKPIIQKPTFEAHQNGDGIEVTITNNSNVIHNISLTGMEDETFKPIQEFFLQPGKTRTLHTDLFDALVLDPGHELNRLGIRLH